MKIQISKNKTIEWVPPWQRSTRAIFDVVGIELGSGLSAGCPAVWLQRRKGAISVQCVGFIDPPNGQLPKTWDDLRHQTRWSVPSAFRADCAALAINSPDAITQQAVTGTQQSDPPITENTPVSKDGIRSIFWRMPGQYTTLQASIPEYQALWLNRLLPEGKRPTTVSVQTAPSALLASLSAQPGFCADSDELAVFITQSKISIAGFRNGLPQLFRECTGSAGAAAMREAVKTTLKLDDSMLDSVFSSNSMVDTTSALTPLLTPIVQQIEQSLEYLKRRLSSSPKRIFLMGNAAGCSALRRVFNNKEPLPLVSPNPFDGLELPSRSVIWKDRYCVGDIPHAFLTAIGAALAALEETK